MKTVEGIRIMFKKETGIDPDNSQGEPDIEYVWWLEKQFIEQSQQIELPSDKEIKYRASLHAGVPCDDPDIYGSHARAIYDECIRIGIWFRDQIKQQLK